MLRKQIDNIRILNIANTDCNNSGGINSVVYPMNYFDKSKNTLRPKYFHSSIIVLILSTINLTPNLFRWLPSWNRASSF